MKWLPALALLCLALPARADVLYDNFGASGDGFNREAWNYLEYTTDLLGLGIHHDLDLLQAFGNHAAAYELTTVELAVARRAGLADAAVVYLASGSPHPETILATRTVTGVVPVLMPGSTYAPVVVDFTGEILPTGETLWVGVSTLDIEAELVWHPTTGASSEPTLALDIVDGVPSWIDVGSPLALRVNVTAERPVTVEPASWGRVKALY